jgi:Inner membrane component of T3SS, cytoplasmic domain/Domain of unknown function (DUF4386)
MVRLKVISGPDGGRWVEVEREIVVGREGADVTVADPEMSRRHLAVRPAERGVEVEDLGSMNGSWIDGQRLEGARLLTGGARLRVGTTEIELEVEPESAPTKAREAPVAEPAVTRARDVPVAEPAVTRARDVPVAEPAVTRARDVPVAEPAVTRARAAAVAQPPADAADEREPATVGLVLALGAGVLAVVANLLHPQPDPDDTNVVAFLETIVPSSGWVVLHLVTLLSIMLGCLAAVLLYRSLAGRAGALLARMGIVLLVIATAMAGVWMILDGIAMKAIADDWAESTGAAQLADERAAVAIEHFILALFSAWLVTWQGLPFILFGLALVRDGRFPAWLGALGVPIGAFSLVLGLVQFYTERDALVTHTLVPLGGVLAGIWFPVVFFLWWRQARALAATARA